ncbi:MAG: hypothetical protein K2X77_17055 [Candidatus Obscuribacterales bacterium]|nr:hypothetical protein [Candidatus Obscuribacterales bacterium]
MKLITEALAKWQLERLEAMCQSLKSRAKNLEIGRKSLVWEHVDLAEDAIDEAVSALRYNKFEQASLSCQDGFVQAGLAELLLRYGAKLDSSLSKYFLLTTDKKKSPNEDMVAYLADSLTQMKLAIEYSNCTVSKRSQSILSQAMDFYNSAIDAIKSEADDDDPERPLHCAQAGLLQVFLASEFISAENQISLPGWRGLSNPMLASPIRRGSELIALLVETKILLRQMEQESVAPIETGGPADKEKLDLFELKSDWELSYHRYVSALNSLASGSTAHAQQLIKEALKDCRAVHQVIADSHVDSFPDLIDDEEAETTETGEKTDLRNFSPIVKQKQKEEPERVAVADLMELLGEVSEMISHVDVQKKTSMSNKLRVISEKYRDAHAAFKQRQFGRAERLASEALFELDVLRDQFKKVSKRTTGKYKIR